MPEATITFNGTITTGAGGMGLISFGDVSGQISSANDVNRSMCISTNNRYHAHDNRVAQ